MPIGQSKQYLNRMREKQPSDRAQNPSTEVTWFSFPLLLQKATGIKCSPLALYTFSYYLKCRGDVAMCCFY